MACPSPSLLRTTPGHSICSTYISFTLFIGIWDKTRHCSIVFPDQPEKEQKEMLQDEQAERRDLQEAQQEEAE
jgi:hypothetical protein